ncbi:MAG: hypothetical protein AAF542_22785 [Pseudomonadota bacterium]
MGISVEAGIELEQNDTDVLVDVRYAQLTLGNCSRQKIWNWIRRGVLPKPKKICNRNYWLRIQPVNATH